MVAPLFGSTVAEGREAVKQGRLGLAAGHGVKTSQLGGKAGGNFRLSEEAFGFAGLEARKRGASK